MNSYSINELFIGLKIIQDGEPCVIINNEFVNPGKGKSFSRIRLKKLISGKILEKTFKPSDSIKKANTKDIIAIFLYEEKNIFHFMEKESFDILYINSIVIGNHKKWLAKNIQYFITLWNEKPILINLPNFIEIMVVKTEPILKKESCYSGKNKLAQLENGTIIKVPLFIKKSDIIRIDTRSKEYVSRISKNKFL